MMQTMTQMMSLMTQMMGQVAQNKTGSVDANPAKKQKTGPVAGVNTGDPEIEAKLDQWLIAKRSKDFASADMIRDELRAQGIDPDTVRPRGWTASAASGASAGAGTGKTGDDWTDEQLDKWLLAKRSKDFVTADAIRDELRSMGVDPDTVRPPGWEVQGNGGKTGDAWMDEQLDKWLIAKRQKDFATADAIRDQLRAMGVDPDTVRPRGWEAHASQTNTGDAWTEMQLDNWLAAKRGKDFATADAIRDELRSMGVDPDTVRPRGYQGGAPSGGGKGSVGSMASAPAPAAMGNDPMAMMQMMTQMMGMMNPQ
jgi:cysteinyl-tRNA synthetase